MNQKLNEKMEQLKKLYQYVRYVRPFAANNARHGMPPDRVNIAIFSEPRGGSTWLAEILCRLPGSFLISEPMFPAFDYDEIRGVKFCGNQYIPEEAEWPEAQAYFRKLFNLEVRSLAALRLYYYNDDLSNIAKAKYFIHKDVNSNMLLSWVTRRFSVNPIYLIRHPCAVIASQLKYKHWDYILKDIRAYFPDPSDRHQELYEHYRDIIGKISLPEERMAAEWALHNVVPVTHPENDRRWITVAYEKLFMAPESELERIFKRLGIAQPAGILDYVRKPSITTVAGSNSFIQSGKQLLSWQKSLTQSQIRNILNITRGFGLDFYDESPEPDYARIYGRAVNTFN